MWSYSCSLSCTASTYAIDGVGNSHVTYWWACTGGDSIDGNIDGVPKEERERDYRAALSYEDWGREISSLLSAGKGKEKNTAYQRAWESSILAAYQPRNVGPLGVSPPIQDPIPLCWAIAKPLQSHCVTKSPGIITDTNTKFTKQLCKRLWKTL